MCKKLIFLIISFNIIFGQEVQLAPVLKSFLIPGWGEKALGNNKHSRFFSNVEISLLTTCIGSYVASHNQMLQYRSFAVAHANVDIEGKNHKYWVDIGNYLDIDDHNSEHLRWRYIDEVYHSDYKWSWDTKKNMQKFEKMRINSDLYKKAGEYILGSIVLNHIISAIDALYLSKINSLTFLPNVNKKTTGMRVIINL